LAAAQTELAMARASRFLAVLPVVLAALAVGAILSEPLPVPLQHIGPVTGDPEKDTFGRDLAGRLPPPPAPRYSDAPRLIGWATGDPEKDTFGLVVLHGDALAATN
jgi:hypothetical protein